MTYKCVYAVVRSSVESNDTDPEAAARSDFDALSNITAAVLWSTRMFSSSDLNAQYVFLPFSCNFFILDIPPILFVCHLYLLV